MNDDFVHTFVWPNTDPKALHTKVTLWSLFLTELYGTIKNEVNFRIKHAIEPCSANLSLQ